MGNPIIHIEFQVKDAQKATKWYGDLFGWDTQYDEKTDYGMFSNGEGQIGGGFNAMAGQPTGTVAYIETDDIAGMLAKAESMGATLIQPETPIPTIGAFALFADPDGTVIGIFKETAP